MRRLALVFGIALQSCLSCLSTGWRPANSTASGCWAFDSPRQDGILVHENVNVLDRSSTKTWHIADTSMATPKLKTDSHPLYRHRPLNTDSSIRILRLLPHRGHQDSPITISLRQLPLEHSRLYYDALSYAWGDRGETKTVTVDDKYKINVTANLHSALRHLRRENDVIQLWVDAICIDQSNTEERTAQLQLMTRIYSTARNVLLWIGTSGGASKRAFDWIHSVHADDTLNQMRNDREKAATVTLDDIIPKQVEQALTATFLDGSTRGLMERTVWGRRWIVQELCMSNRDPVVICGDERLPFSHLPEIARTLWAISRDTGFKMLGQSERYSLLQPFLTIVELTGAKLHVREHRLDLAHALKRAVPFACSDARDYVYSLVSLVSFKLPPIVPDYNKTTTEVFIDATRVLMEESDSLDPMCSQLAAAEPMSSRIDLERWRPQASDNVPSWLPNLAHRYYGTGTVVVDHHQASRKKLRWDALNQIGRGVIKVDMLPSGSIDEMLPYLELRPENSDMERVMKMRRWNPLALRPIKGTQEEDFQRHLIRALLRDLDPKSSSDKKLSTEALDTYWRAFEAYLDPQSSISEAAGLSGPGIAKAADETAQHSGLGETLATHWEKYLKSGNETPDAADVPDFSHALALSRKIAHPLMRTRFGRTSDRRLGWFPKEARAGDIIGVVGGSRVPFVLRPYQGDVDVVDGWQGLEAYKMIGTCYVQGIMDGEDQDHTNGEVLNDRAVLLV